MLHRSLGLADVTLFFVITGSNLQWVASAAAAGPSSLIVWIIGVFAMFVPLAIAVVYLTTHHPDEGGLYVWAKRAFGPLAGFITGWTYWTSNLPYLPALLYFAAGNALLFNSKLAAAMGSTPAYFIAFSLGGLLLGTVLNVYGLEVGKWLNNIGAVSRWAVTLVLIALGIAFWHRFGATTAINATTIQPATHLKDLIFWSVIAFAWTGPEAASFMAGEIKRPRRTIPFAFALSAPVTATIYILGTASVLAIVQANSVDPSSGVMQAISAASARFGWWMLAPVAALLVAASCLGSCGAWLGAIARIPFVAGIDNYLPKAFGYAHPRFGSPVVALVTQAVIAAIFVLLGQGGMSVRAAYAVLVSTTVLITMLPFLYVFAAAIKLGAEPVDGEMIRIPGGRWTVVLASIVGIVTTCAAMVLAVVPASDEPNKVLAVAKVLLLTALMIGSGLFVYWLGVRRARIAA
ncbi:MAG: APC family permease [Candidatus Eremiobacteraeota bacterium]|nr:APC family permease [Candidatus Eremiobacteraeota bacterium]